MTHFGLQQEFGKRCKLPNVFVQSPVQFVLFANSPVQFTENINFCEEFLITEIYKTYILNVYLISEVLQKQFLVQTLVTQSFAQRSYFY